MTLRGRAMAAAGLALALGLAPAAAQGALGSSPLAVAPTGDALVDRARAALAENKVEAAARLLEDAGPLRSGRAAALLGTLLLSAHQPAQARRVLLESCSKTPSDPYAHGLLATAYAQMGQDTEGLREALRARELDPARPDALWVLTEIYAHMHRYGDMVAACVELARRFPADPVAPFRAALGEAGQGHFEKALEWARRAVELGPAQARPMLLLSRIEDRLGRKDDAARHATAAAKLGLTAADLLEAQMGQPPGPVGAR